MTPIAARKKIPLLDLGALHAPMRAELLAELTRIVDSQKFIMGEDVKDLEKLMAEYSGTRFGVGCASGSDALYLALAAAGIGAGDRVLTTSYSFFATAGAITRTGATPVFVDIDPATYNIDPHQVAAALERDERIKAIIPVHLFGACADMDPILESARKHNCVVIEDGAQAIGAEYKSRKAQSIGDAGCISFFPSKNLGGFGDGGMTLTSNEALAGKMAALRVHGSLKKYYHEMVGINSRLDTMQAVVLKVKFRYLEEWTSGREQNAKLYCQMLSKTAPFIGLPQTASYQTRHVYNQFVIRSAERDALKTWLQDHGIGTEVYYPLPLHLQPCYRDLGYKPGDLPESEKAANESLALPIHSALAEEDIAYVCQVIAEFPSTVRGQA